MEQALTSQHSYWGDSSHPVVALRAILLMLKLISLASAIDDGTHKQTAINVLWDSVQKASDNLNMHNTSKCPNPIGCLPHGPAAAEEAEEEVHLSHLVTPLLLSAMKQDLKGKGETIKTCCSLLHTMTRKTGLASQAVMSEVIQTGRRLCSMSVQCVCHAYLYTVSLVHSLLRPFC